MMPSIFSSSTAVLLATAATDVTGFLDLFFRIVGDGWQSFLRRWHLVILLTAYHLQLARKSK
jgi:hypothetical protein